MFELLEWWNKESVKLSADGNGRTVQALALWDRPLKEVFRIETPCQLEQTPLASRSFHLVPWCFSF